MDQSKCQPKKRDSSFWLSALLLISVKLELTACSDSSQFNYNSESSALLQSSNNSSSLIGAPSPNIFTNCGGVLGGKDSGTVHSPYFPKAFPVPIYCRWTIEAPSGKVVIVYLTQFFLRDGFRATEYAFLDSSLNVGRKELGPITYEDGSAVIASSKPILVLELEVQDAANIHLRVMDFFLDVFGFNITYQIVAKEKQEHQQACSVSICSFTGNCYANVDFRYHYCACFSGFFGRNCEFGPSCDPSKGVNPCKNSATCRYAHGGSHITCDCPPGFTGIDCSLSTFPVTSHKSSLSDGCDEHKRCSPGTCPLALPPNEYSSSSVAGAETSAIEQEQNCVCNGGRLSVVSIGHGHESLTSSSTNECVSLGKMRYVVRLKLYDSNVDIKHLDKARFHELKTGIELAVLTAMRPYLQSGSSHLRVLEFKAGAEVELHFFHNEDNEDKVKSRFIDKIRSGRLGRYAVDKNFVEVHKEPALNIISVETNVLMPVTEKSELNITCSILGSNSLEVTWFKDGALINFSHSIERQLSERVIGRQTEEKGHYLAELYIERVDLLDSGHFTCQVRDWGFLLNRTIRVEVNVLAQPTISPLTQTVWEGERVVITCFSREDAALRKYGYNWLKNGEILNPIRENEHIEDLYPTGSRVLIYKASRSATYTCLATTPAGTAFKESRISVVPRFNVSGSLPTCPNEHKDNMDWPITGANSDYLQHCPPGYEQGEVSRTCRLMDSIKTVWLEPDYSKCFTHTFLSIREKFRRLRLGYDVTNILDISKDLTTHLHGHKLKKSEGEPVVEFLMDCFGYLQTIPIDKLSLEQTTDYILDMLSVLLDHPGSISKPNDISMAHHLIVEFTLLRSTIRQSIYTQVSRKNFWAEVVKVEPVDGMVQLPLARSDNKIKKRKSNGVASVLEAINHIPGWLSDAVELNMTRLHDSSASVVPEERITLAVFYRNLGSFLPKHFLQRRRLSDLEYQIHSRLVTVALLNNASKSVGHKASKLQITAHLKHYNTTTYIPPADSAVIACGLAEFSDRIGFHTQNCKTSSSSSLDKATVCLCDLTGTYAIILASQIKHRKSEPILVELELVAGCATCVLFVILTFFGLFIKPRRLLNPITALKVQVCLSIIGCQVSLLAIIYPQILPNMLHHAYSAAMFFQIVAFSLQVCFCATIYAQVSSSSQVISRPEAKISFLGWAIPISVTGASLAAQALEGFPVKEWTFLFGRRLFYSTAITASLLTVCHFFLYLHVRIEFIKRHRVDTASDKKTRSRPPSGRAALNQSLTITTCLVVVLTSLILYENYPQDVRYKHAFAISSASLGLVTFVCFILCSDRLSKSNKKFASNSQKRLSDNLAEKAKHESFPLTNHITASSRYELDAGTYDAYNGPQVIAMNHVNHVTVHSNHTNHLNHIANHVS